MKQHLVNEGKNMARILIIDDHPVALRLLRHVLEKTNHTVRSEIGAEAALSTFDEFKPNMVITDQNMPGMCGDELTRILKEKYPGLLIIILSSSEVPASHKADIVIDKAQSSEELQRAVKKLLTLR